VIQALVPASAGNSRFVGEGSRDVEIEPDDFDAVVRADQRVDSNYSNESAGLNQYAKGFGSGNCQCVGLEVGGELVSKAWEFVQQEICRRRSAVAAALVGEEAVEIIEEGRPETNEAFRHQR
jgi:hypothetical protein